MMERPLKHAHYVTVNCRNIPISQVTGPGVPFWV